MDDRRGFFLLDIYRKPRIFIGQLSETLYSYWTVIGCLVFLLDSYKSPVFSLCYRASIPHWAADTASMYNSAPVGGRPFLC